MHADRSLRRRALDGLAHLRGSPEDIARGAALGTLVAFTPTLGVQMVLAAAIATWAGASRPAAVVPVWITNPATVVPLYVFTYRVGAWFLPGPTTAHVSERLAAAEAAIRSVAFWRLDVHLAAVTGVGWEVFRVLMVGGVIVGTVAGAITYLVVLRLVRLGRHELQVLAAKARRAGDRDRS